MEYQRRQNAIIERQKAIAAARKAKEEAAALSAAIQHQPPHQHPLWRQSR